MVLELQTDNVELRAGNVKMGTEIQLLKENQKQAAESVAKVHRKVTSLNQTKFRTF